MTAGYVYNLHWKLGLDFEQLLLNSDYLYRLEDPNTIIRFNFTTQRELYDVYHSYRKTLMDRDLRESQLDTFIDPVTNTVQTGENKC